MSQSEPEKPFGICPMGAVPIGFNGDYLQFVSGWIIIVGGGVFDSNRGFSFRQTGLLGTLESPLGSSL